MHYNRGSELYVTQGEFFMNTENTTKKILHPRPDKWREEFINLNGEWEFFFDEPTYDRRITVPFSWASPLSGIGKFLAPRA